MFGYVKPFTPELRVKDFALYRGFYCGLCKTLRRKYGIKSKFLLNYDCTFAALLLSLVCDDRKEYCKAQRCSFNPLGRKVPVAQPSRPLDFAAALNVLLAYYSMQDNWQDEKKIVSRAGAALYRRAMQRAAREYPQVNIAVRKALRTLHTAEEMRVADIDTAANASAELLSAAVSCYGFDDESTGVIMRIMCFNIGRWIYLADAWNDREADKKSGSYNPFNLVDADRDKAMHLMYLALKNARDAYELMEKNESSPIADIIENVLEHGCVETTESVLNGSFGKKKTSSEYVYKKDETEETEGNK